MGFDSGPSARARAATHGGTGAQPRPEIGRFLPTAPALPAQHTNAQVIAHLPEGPTLGSPTRPLPTYVEARTHSRAASVRMPPGGLHAVMHTPRSGGV